MRPFLIWRSVDVRTNPRRSGCVTDALNTDANDGLTIGTRLEVCEKLLVTPAETTPPPMMFSRNVGPNPDVCTVSPGMRVSLGAAVSGLVVCAALVARLTAGS